MEGLIGQGVRDALESLDHTVLGCDLRSLCETKKFDLRNADKLRSALAECDGVLHLGALSRVIWGEMHPALCHSINVGGVITLTKVISEMPRKIWLIFASSREIYGTPSKLPCTSDMSPHPENLYAHTKMVGENMVWDMRCRGFCVAVIRLSNVFGTANDYHDRVVPAFAKAAAHGGVLHIRGADSALDFTPLEDAVNAIVRVVQLIDGGVFDLPAIDIVTGRATSLAELAQIALAHAAAAVLSTRQAVLFIRRNFKAILVRQKNIWGGFRKYLWKMR